MQRSRRYRRQHYQQRRRAPCLCSSSKQQQHQQQQHSHPKQQTEQAEQHSRCIRFRSTITNRQTPPLGGSGIPTANDDTAKASSSLPRNDLEHFEVVCHINYGDFRKVQVQFIAADQKICAFAWKRKRRMQLRQQHKHHPHHHRSTSSASASDVHSDDEDAVADVGVEAKDVLPVNADERECQECLPQATESCTSVKKDADDHIEQFAKVAGDTPACDSVVNDSDDEVFWPKQEEGDGDHNHLITAPAQQQQSISTTTTTTNNKNGIVPNSNSSSKPQTPTTENHENTNGSQHHLHNNRNKQNNNVTTTRSSSQTPSPTLSQQHGRKIHNTASNFSTTLEKKSSSKLQSSSRKLPQKQQCSSEEVVTQESPSAVELQQTTKALKHQQTGVEAMGVLLQYLVFDLDAFACPAVKLERTKAKESLTKTMHLLDEAKSVCNELQYQLCDKELYYAQREEELQALHRCELEKAQLNLSEAELRASEQISALKTEIRVMDIEQKRSLDCYRTEMDNKLAQNQKHLLAAEQREKDLIERVAALEASELNLKMQLQAAEESSAQRLQASKLRERELLEKIRVLNLELDMLRETKDSSERELKDKLNLSQDEISVLRISSRRSLNNESMERGGSSPRNSSSTSVPAAALEITRLQSEAESLRCVLELKQKEISKLTKQNEELIRDADERNALQAKISLLESSNEMFQSELEIKSDKEKDFLRQIDDIQKAFNHETVKRTRLSYDNEALQWQLKQRSEQLHIVEAKLQELSSHELQNSQNSSLGSHSLNRSSQNGASLMNFQVDDDVSPPASPVIKAVIEKTDSVSWVLEMDDDTPEAAASKMVKRAGSFRSVERSPSTRRQLSQSANAATTMNGSSTCNGGAGGPNPLSQSMSAASVIRQHSNGTTDFLGRANSRIRSKSVSVKSTEPTAAAAGSNKSNSKKLLRQCSTGNTRKQELTSGVWKEPISSSSPYPGVRQRSSTMKCAAEQDETFFRRSSRKLITCDTSALNTGERLELRGLPTHPSVHDLKVHKKSQQIQESAGEAMVSGTNSEDEGCSHSSDEVVSSSTTSTSSAASATSGSSLSLNNIKNHHHMSLEEEVLLLDKINSLNGTPMEVSWSDDADAFSTNAGSTV